MQFAPTELRQSVDQVSLARPLLDRTISLQFIGLRLRQSDVSGGTASTRR